MEEVSPKMFILPGPPLAYLHWPTYTGLPTLADLRFAPGVLWRLGRSGCIQIALRGLLIAFSSSKECYLISTLSLPTWSLELCFLLQIKEVSKLGRLRQFGPAFQ
ncbi:predicted protein [Aspergillus nidulans FGSC A4]|uniref:Uncharacterized protein n=1 Tax=Emericella nidulans (strain FGSC A4 / ATCC 38163 / CBS 112.46 / NRRL 194 / M139) TaxID=227321 RepID=Q5AWP9_EMENI|nr:hypothetical protein [Aspergillus nidulans FGSC A4]EAA61152.1 predicted protein [Aspergillus nidulans FGSC A4]CBF78705.1 TPA: hypothetical protein ANIA_07281 [Aspergillus nidulans FGSC A4]|eukprot:XP_680550.1 predicted protein [Aspergillus nidulans FGSC A4]